MSSQHGIPVPEGLAIEKHGWGTGTFLVLLGITFSAAGLAAVPHLLERLLGHGLTPAETVELTMVRVGLVLIGLIATGWGVNELRLRHKGPSSLFSMLCLTPLLVPFLSLGFGSDPDAWAVAADAWRSYLEGRYWMSRPPGFPLFELLAWVLVPKTGWVLLLTANLLTGLGLITLWRRFTPDTEESHRRLIAVCLMAQPLFLLGCVVGLDYIHQAFWLSVAALAILRVVNHPSSRIWVWSALGGSAVGVATGFRLNSILSILLLVPFLCLVGDLTKRQRVLALVTFSGVLAITTVAAESIVLHQYGFSKFFVHPDTPALQIVLYRLLRWWLPPISVAVLLAGLVWMPRTWKTLSSNQQRLVLLAMGFVFVFLAAFLGLPREPGYLTATVPFLAVLAGMLVPRPVLAGSIPLLLGWSLVAIPIVVPHQKTEWSWNFGLERGPLVEEATLRLEGLRRGQQLLNITPRRKTAVIAGFDFAQLAFLRPHWRHGNGLLVNPDFPVRFYNFLPEAELESLQSQGYRFLVVGQSDRFTLAKYGYDLRDYGAVDWNPRERFLIPEQEP